MGDHGKYKKPCRVFVDVFGIMKTLCNEIAHDGTGDPADQMHDKRQCFLWITGKNSPGNMVNGHGKNGNDLDGVGT